MRAQAALQFVGLLLIVAGVFMPIFGLLVVDGRAVTMEDIVPMAGVFIGLGLAIYLLGSWRHLCNRSGS